MDGLCISVVVVPPDLVETMTEIYSSEEYQVEREFFERSGKRLFLCTRGGITFSREQEGITSAIKATFGTSEDYPLESFGQSVRNTWTPRA